MGLDGGADAGVTAGFRWRARHGRAFLQQTHGGRELG